MYKGISLYGIKLSFHTNICIGAVASRRFNRTFQWVSVRPLSTYHNSMCKISICSTTFSSKSRCDDLGQPIRVLE